MAETNDIRNVIVLGGGPAGLTAAIYAARANLRPLVIEGGEAGGQLMLTTLVENYGGFADGIMGPDLMAAMRTQAERVGAEFLTEDATRVDLSQRPFRVTTQSGMEVRARAVIVATGASAKMLGLPSEGKLLGRGVSTCATCDGFFFRNQDVIVVGGGDSAMEEALYLANMTRAVTVVHRRDVLRASKIMQERARKHPRIDFIWNAEVADILGGEKVRGVRLRDTRSGDITERPIDGIFVAIGHRPNTALFKGQLTMDPNGYLVPQSGTRSNVAGVFLAGDVHDHTYRQAVTAAAFGCMAAMDAERWLQGDEALGPEAHWAAGTKAGEPATAVPARARPAS
ncbi:MAG: thioredoxin-disulfide reductase [bacterium]